MNDAVSTLEAQKIARPVRGCATDKQFIDLVDRIAAALLVERERADKLLAVVDAAKELLEVLETGPLEWAAKYGPDSHPDEIGAANKLRAALAVLGGK